MLLLRHEHRVAIRGAPASFKKLAFGMVWCSMLLHGAAIPTHDFGSVAVNATAATYNLSATVSGVSAAPVWSVTGNPYSIGSVSCTVTVGVASCNIPIHFAPQYPGLQLGALYAKSAGGSLLATYFLQGVGTASQLVFSPGTISTLAGNHGFGYADGTLSNASFSNPSGMAMDQAGNLYVADAVSQVVRKVNTTNVSTVAGNGTAGYTGDNGLATAAELTNPTGVALDAANNLYIADQGNNVIRRVDAVSGLITTVAGGGSVFVSAFSTNVSALSAVLYGPQAVTLDSSGNLFISDSYYQIIYRVDAATGLITLYAGNGGGGGTDGWGDGGAATAAILSNPNGLALDASGNLYIADTGHSMVRMVNAASGIITGIAGTGNYSYSGDRGLATSAGLQSPTGVAIDAAGNLYIADSGSSVVRQTLAANGTIITIAGTGSPGYTGDGGSSTAATLANPSAVALSPSGTLYIADTANWVIRQVSPVSPSLRFGSVVVGAASQSQPVTVINRGNQPLNISNGSFGSGFKQVAGLDDCTSTSVLAPGGTCSANMAFAPSASGPASTSLSLTTNSLNVVSAQSVGMSGTGIAGTVPIAAVSSTSLSFGALPVFATQAQTVSLTNSGGAPLTIFGVSLAGDGSAAFSLSTTCGGSLPAGSSCLSAITFSPTARGTYSASLTFNDSAGNSPQVITMSGTGKVGTPSGLVQQWDNNGILWLLSYEASGGTVSVINWTNTGQGFGSIGNGTPGLIPMDMNGDGKLDVVQQWNNNGVLWLLPYISNGSTFNFTNWTNTGQGYSSGPSGTPSLISMDLNGDGKTDLVQQWDNNGILWLLPYFSNGSTFNVTNWINTGQGFASTPNGTPGFLVMDLNGDGKLDLVQQWDNNGIIWLLPYISSGTSLIPTNWINTGQGYASIPNGTPGFLVMDINGDGKMDLVQQWDNNGIIWLLPYISTGTSLVPTNWINTGQGYSSNPDGTPDFIALDINGDGKTDLVQQWDNNGILWLLPYVSNGSTFAPSNWINTGQGYGSTPNGTPSLIAMDLNGDGKTDLLQQWDNQGVIWLLPYISNGATFNVTNWINTGQGYGSANGTPGFLGGSLIKPIAP